MRSSESPALDATIVTERLGKLLSAKFHVVLAGIDGVLGR